MSDLREQLLARLEPGGALASALNVVVTFWFYGSVFVVCLLGTLGPWPWWTAALALAVFALGVLLAWALMVHRHRHVEEIDQGTARWEELRRDVQRARAETVPLIHLDSCLIDGERVPTPDHLRRVMAHFETADVAHALTPAEVEALRRLHRRGMLPPVYWPLVGRCLDALPHDEGRG